MRVGITTPEEGCNDDDCEQCPDDNGQSNPFSEGCPLSLIRKSIYSRQTRGDGEYRGGGEKSLALRHVHGYDPFNVGDRRTLNRDSINR